MNILVNLSAVALILLIIWWFWLWRPASAAQAKQGIIDIRVDNGVYSPAHIEIPLGRATTLRFLREDPSPCAEMVLIDGLGISAELPLHKPRELVVTPSQPGRYEFSCQMHMYRGEILVS